MFLPNLRRHGAVCRFSNTTTAFRFEALGQFPRRACSDFERAELRGRTRTSSFARCCHFTASAIQ
jgi:hypothetical protein